jgi:hypothetical protein
LVEKLEDLTRKQKNKLVDLQEKNDNMNEVISKYEQQLKDVNNNINEKTQKENQIC